MKIDRRNFLTSGLSAGVSVSMRASLLGLPVSFLVNGSVMAASVNPKFTIVAISADGEATNINCPGSYPKNNTDIAGGIQHPSEQLIGLGIKDRINGTAVDVRDLENSTDIIMGNQTVKAPRAYGALDADFLSKMACFFHRTHVNAHAELPAVLNAGGGLRLTSGRGVEQLPSALAQELAPSLGTLMKKPVVLHGNGSCSYQGVRLNTYHAATLKSMMTGDPSFRISPENFSTLYDWSVNSIYKDLKKNGTPKQKRFLDDHLSSRLQAAELGSELGDLLTDVNNNSQENQLRTALALFKLKITPAVVVHHDHSGDNHSNGLSRETSATFDALKSLDTYWKLLQRYNLTNDVLYTTVNVFGRTPVLNRDGGRDHYGVFTNALIHGENITGGIAGGLENGGGNSEIRATGINSLTGGIERPDIDADNTLPALFKTVMAAAGVSEDRLNMRVPDGRVVRSLLS